MISLASIAQGGHWIRNQATRRCGLQSARAAVFAAATVAACLGGPCVKPAFGQSTFYYGGTTRTWSNSLSWWQNYAGTLQSGSAPAATDTAVFNVSGSNAAGTALFTGDAGINRILVLPTATGGLTLRGDGSGDRTLTLGAGGIRALPTNAAAFTIGSSTTGQGLRVSLGATQEWRLASGALTIANPVAGTAGSSAAQTLLISSSGAITGTGGGFSDGTNGGVLNLWINSAGVISLASANTTLTGTLTLQNAWGGGGGLTSGTYASIRELQLAGGQVAGPTALSGSNTIRLLGGWSRQAGVLTNAGSLQRQVGGGLITLSDASSGYTNNPSVGGLIPWMFNSTRIAGWMTTQTGTAATVPLIDFNSNINAITSGSNWNLQYRTSTLSGNRTANAVRIGDGGNTLTSTDLSAFALELNALDFAKDMNTGPYEPGTAQLSATGGGWLQIGSSGEIVITTRNNYVTLAAPIRGPGWITLGVLNDGSFNLASFTLSGSNSHTGGTSIVSRGLNLNNAYALGSGTFRIGGNAIVLDNTSAGPITIATTNLHEWNSDFTFAGTQGLNLGTGTVSLGTWAGRVRNVTVNAGNLTVGGRIIDGTHPDLPTTTLAKQGNGTLILTGSNGYTGATEAWGGDLRFGTTNALYGGDTSKWTAANITTGSGAVLSVSVGSGAGAFTSGNLDTLAGMASDTGGFQSGSYLGIDTTNVSGTYTYATNVANPNGGANVLGIAKVGAGTLELSGNNTFTGGVMVRGGTLLVTATQQVGAGTLVAAGGLLDMNGLTASNSFSITSGTIANTTIAANKITTNVTGLAVISGTLTGTGANGNVTKSGTGTLVLTAANTYTGTTTLSAGLVSIASDANIGGTGAALVFSGGGLQVTGTNLTSLATARPTTFSSGAAVSFDIADAANTFTVSQNLQQGSGGLTKSGPGTLVVSGTNTYTGATTVTGGTLRLGSGTSLGGAGAALTVSGGALDLNGNSVSKGTTTFSGGVVTGGTLTSNATYAAQSGTVAAGLAGTVGLTKSTTGLLVLSGTNTFSGITNINAGILRYGQPASLYGGTTAQWTRTNIVMPDRAGATLALNVGGAGEFTNADLATLLVGVGTSINNNGFYKGNFVGFDTTNSGTAFTLSGTIADTVGTGGGTLGLVKLGSGTLLVSASNTFTGATRVGVAGGPNAGTLQVASTGFVSPTVLVFGGTFDTAGQNRSITTLTLGGGAAGSAAGLQTGSGTVTIGGTVAYDGSTAANGASIEGNLNLGGAVRTFDLVDSSAAAADLTVSAVIGNGGLTKLGLGTLVLSGSSTFVGTSTVGLGTAEIGWIAAAGQPSPLGSGTTLNLGSGDGTGTLRWVGTTSSTTSRVLNLSGSNGGGGVEANGSGALVLSSEVTAANGSKSFTLGGTSTADNTMGVIGTPTTGSLSVVKDGPGLWRLTGVSTFDGGLTVKNGTVVATVNSGGSTDAGAFGKSQSVTVGDSTAGAAGTAALLLAAGVNSNKVIIVPATSGGSQAVVLGSQGTSGTSASFDNQVRLSRAVTLVAATSGTTTFGNFWYDSSGAAAPTVNVSIGSSGNLGTVLLKNNLTTTGSVGVRFGTLNVDDSKTLTAAGIVGIDGGATLAGVGTVAATLGGAGFVAPGNSPGILTANAVDPTAGLDFNFEFTGTTPAYGTAASSTNDVLRLTGSSAFTTLLSSSNAINVYLDVGSLALNNTFRGGFFTDLAGDFRSSIADATYTYWVSGTGAGQTTYENKTYMPFSSVYPSLSMDATTVADTATFAGGSPTSGQVMQFTVVVPEPGAMALAALGLGLAGYALRRRRVA